VSGDVCYDHGSILFSIQSLYLIFESYVYHVEADKLVNLPTKNGGKFCWTVLMDGLWS